jgi:prevent-host-death family protein
MRSISARRAYKGFAELLASVEGGEEVIITKHGRPVAVLAPFRPPALATAREAAIAHAVAVMEKGLSWPNDHRSFTRDEMHER